MSITEPENFRVQLVQNASELAWFTVTPARAYQSMGDLVIAGSKVKFSVTVAEDEFLHISKKEFVHPNPLLQDAHEQFAIEGHSCRETNASLDQSEWDVNLFTAYTNSRAAP